ncbi:hypothetical protein HZS61_005189 [Fusarium oxysporum f. sp. conglutinans]|uniref:HTH CENPB-type domain-containing protein n=1 Tax=Fusarium oxysporum f. sp. conglutinans TaxID=100902 RepID=A0A8H6LDL1_FUSOX|nr:hypothetical protein HZS61_005189 [Fusarium oxysporum f. sp. conglutinans]
MHPPPRNNQPPLPFRPPHISPSHLLGTLRPPSPFHHHLRLRDRSIHPPSPLPFGLPFQSPYSLFEIRLDQDLIVLRGNCDEAQGQVLRGVLVLCLQSPLKLEEVSLDLVGTLHHSWAEPEPLAHENTILYHKWPTFVGSRDNHMTLPAGNYEWPFEYTLPGNAVETVEGMPEARISYRLKATVTRPRLIRDIHARKQFRIFRIPSPDALELMQSTSIERTLKEKVDFSINLSPGAVILGGSVMLEMRFTPLIKGLDLQHFSAALIEFRKFHVQNRPLFHPREYRTERTVSTWHFQVSEDQDWQDMLDGTGQEGWAITKKLDIPNRLCECIQDTNVCGIKVYHKKGILSTRDSILKSRKLSDLEEQIIVQFILDLDSRGFPQRLRSVEEMANRLLADRETPPVGKRWASNFVKRHKDLKTHFFRKYDYQRAKCEDPTIIGNWFRLVANVIAKYGIRPDEIYNFDETGFMMGVIASGMVVTGAERRGRPKSVQPGNREWITVIQAINAESQAIPPFIIGVLPSNQRIAIVS